MTQKQRMKRKKIYARRRRLILACVLLLCVGLILLCVALLKIFTGPESTPSDPSRSETVSATETTPPPTTATTVPAPTANPTLDSQITATGAVIYDKTAGRLLYSKNGTLKLYPASMTKLLTAITAIEYGTEGLTFTVGTEIKLLGLNSSTAGLEAGDQLTFPMLLDLMMLPSGNDASYVVAAHIGRLSLENDDASDAEAVAEFARMMNETARELGAENSHFTNPDGYHDPEHYSTAEDMLLITQRAMEIPSIRESVVKSGSYDEYKALLQYVRSHDLTVQENYDYVCSIVDVDELANWWIVESFFNNTDTGNIRFYKEKGEGHKWRWILYDLDWALSPSTYDWNMVEEIVNPSGHGVGHNFSTDLMCGLMKNRTFREKFITTYGSYLRTVFATERLLSIYDGLIAEISDEMVYHMQRWAKTDNSVGGAVVAPRSLESWKANCDRLRGIVEKKTAMTRQNVIDTFTKSSYTRAYRMTEADVLALLDKE